MIDQLSVFRGGLSKYLLQYLNDSETALQMRSGLLDKFPFPSRFSCAFCPVISQKILVSVPTQQKSKDIAVISRTNVTLVFYFSRFDFEDGYTQCRNGSLSSRGNLTRDVL